MSIRFACALLLAGGIHAAIYLLVPVDHQPVLKVSRGEVCVEFATSAPSNPRPDTAPPKFVRTPEPKQPETPSKPAEKKVEQPVKKPEPPRPPEKKIEQPVQKPEPPRPPEKKVEQPVKKPEPAKAPAPEKKSESPSARETAKPDKVESLPQPASQSSSAQTSGVRTDVRLLGSQKPTYPREAQLRGQEGEVVLSLDISAKGTVTKVQLHRSSGYRLLDDSATRFAQEVEFIPAREGGKPVPTTILLPVRFRLVDR